MLSLVARDMHDWHEAGLPFTQVGVNVSTADFYMGDLVRKLENSFGLMEVPLTGLVLEVNEDTSIGRGDKVVARQIERLRHHGVQVALDDFGTGYASLTHLLRVPVDEIKIDRSFIARLWPDDPSMAIVQGLIDIARQLNIRVVAEGVETEVQASQLWSMGCAYGQGFDFSRPVDRNAMRDLLRRYGAGVPGSIAMASPNTMGSVPTKLPLKRRAGMR
jgi:EAL domain-containing protein (putative c-di-GMP-specific phosphodiesterase class I)